MGGAAVFVDVCAVRLCTKHMYLCPQTCKQFFCGGGGAAVCAVQCNAHAGAVGLYTASQVGNIVLSGGSVFCNCPHIRAGLQYDLFRMIQNQCFNFCLSCIRELIAGSSEQLDAVEFHAVVRSGNHNAGIRTVCPHQIGHCRCGNNAQSHRLSADRTNAGTECCFQNIRRNPGIFSDKNFCAVLRLFCQNQCCCTADLHCHLACQFCNCNASCAVCSK